MEAGVGVNSPEFLQKKIERLKTALDEANVLMDRHVTERDEARAQLDALRRENSELKAQLESGGGAPAATPEAAPAIDGELERELRDRIAQLEREMGERTGDLERQLGERTAELERERQRETFQAEGGDVDPDLSGRIDALQRELDETRRELDDARRDVDAARADADTARADAETARSDANTARTDADSARRAADDARRDSEAARAALSQLPGRTESTVGVAMHSGDGDLPSPGPFVSQEVIRDALDHDKFVLFCQPVFSLQAERITQYELLLRLRDGDGRMVRPFGFLEPADRYGLMAEIDRWVVGHALDLLAADATGDLRLEVNIAGQSLGDFELTALIEQQIAVTDLDPGRLILEVSENVAAAHLEDCQRLAKRLRGLGVGFALDDFGSTFASFRHLRDLPVNFLKIDGDLVVTVTESRTGQLTIKSLVELAKGLGAETIAEYVSDDQTLEFLREQGVSYAQGYRIGRPRPIEEVLGGGAAAAPTQPAQPVRVERPALESGDEFEGADDQSDVTPSETT